MNFLGPQLHKIFTNRKIFYHQGLSKIEKFQFLFEYNKYLESISLSYQQQERVNKENSNKADNY